MLKCEDCRRREERYLIIVADTLEYRSYGDFRFPEADVAAQKSVHRNVGLHVLLDLGDAPRLIFRLLKLKKGFKILLQFRIGRKRMTFDLSSCVIKRDQLFCEVFDRVLDSRLRLLPFVAAEFVEFDFDTAVPDGVF